MHRLSVSLFILLAGSFTFAQTSSNPSDVWKNLPITSRQQFANFGCPVGFAANRKAPVQIMSADDARRSGPTQGLHLKLQNLKNMPDIESIEVTVYGISQKGLMLPVGSPFTDTISKTFKLHRTADDTTLSDADVSMRLAGSLNRADLISITYADGTSWHATPNFQCHAVPSNLLLVGSK